MFINLSPVRGQLQQESAGQQLPVLTEKFNPSNWLQQAENSLILMESRLMSGSDTAFMVSAFDRLTRDVELTRKDFELQQHQMRIRTLDDIKGKLLQQKSQLDTWRNQIRKINNNLTQDFQEIEKLKQNALKVQLRSDSLLWDIYAGEFEETDSMVSKLEARFQTELTKTVHIESRLNKATYALSQVILSVDKELRHRNDVLFTQTHPAFWQLRKDSYEQNIGSVSAQTVKQNLDALKFYGKNAYIRAILFRILVLVITLLPVMYFRRNKTKFNAESNYHPFKFVHKYTAASASSFVLVMAPFVFINSPHIFTETILVTLAFTTSMIFVKENPGIGKGNVYALLVIYALLKLMNLMVSPTLFGRIVWTLSIIGLYPIVAIFRNIPKTNIQYKGRYRLVILLAGLMFIAGWILNFTGYYSLGRTLLMAGLDQFFLAIVLFVAIYSLIDFIAVLADMYNTGNRITTIRVDLIYRKLLNLIRFMAIVFWIWTFIVNINADDFLREHVFKLFSQKFNIGSYAISPGSIFIFFCILYLAFYLSGLLDGLFLDEKRSSESKSKTSLGSIVLLLRLFILSLGFILGMIIAGIPLDNISLFFGALGVGIGFGLQGLIANLISGIIIAFEKPVYVGDIIEVEGQRGRVTDIGLRATKVDTADGAEYIVPNGSLVGNILKNWTLTSKYFKVEISFITGTQANPDEVIQIAREVLENEPEILKQPAFKVQLQDVTAKTMRFSVSCWIGDIADGSNIRSQMLKGIHMKLMEAGIQTNKTTERP